jgi:hypothetical protein
VWPDLKDQLVIEQEQLQQLFELHRPLLETSRHQEPNPIELSALGAFLHSFYTGVENLFRRVTLELGDSLPQNEAWHQRLLQRMTAPAESRPALISTELGDQLKVYLQFRHVFRQAYSFQLHWAKMAPLVLASEEVFGRLREEVTLFVDRMDER